MVCFFCMTRCLGTQNKRHKKQGAGGGGGGGTGHGHPRITPSYAPVGASYFNKFFKSRRGGGETLIQTRSIFEEGCYCFANLWST